MEKVTYPLPGTVSVAFDYCEVQDSKSHYKQFLEHYRNSYKDKDFMIRLYKWVAGYIQIIKQNIPAIYFDGNHWRIAVIKEYMK